MTKYVALLIGDHRTKLDDGVKRVNAGLEILQRAAKRVANPVFVHYDRKEILYSVVYEADKEIEVNSLLQQSVVKKSQEKAIPSSTVTKADKKEGEKAEGGEEEKKEEDTLSELEKEPEEE